MALSECSASSKRQMKTCCSLSLTLSVFLFLCLVLSCLPLTRQSPSSGRVKLASFEFDCILNRFSHELPWKRAGKKQQRQHKMATELFGEAVFSVGEICALQKTLLHSRRWPTAELVLVFAHSVVSLSHSGGGGGSSSSSSLREYHHPSATVRG